MVLLESNDAIFKDPAGLAFLDGDLIQTRGKVGDQLLRPVEKTENILKSGIRGQVNAGLIELRGGEAGQEMEVFRPPGCQDLREQGHDLWQTFTVPQGAGAIHGGSHHEPASGMIGADTMQDISDLSEDWLDLLGHELWTLGIGDEAGDGGHDAHVRLGSNLLERCQEVLLDAADDHLTGLDVGVGTLRVLGDVETKIRIADEGEKKSHFLVN